MRKVIAAINMTIDGFCDHTAITPDKEIHQHYENLLLNAGVILYGRITYQLMQYWQELLEHPSGEKSMDDFAVAIDKIPKFVFSHSLETTGWDSATLSQTSLQETVVAIKNQPGKDILVGSRSIIIQLLQLGLIDELQLCIHPVIAGNGLPLFKDINQRMLLKHTKTKNFEGGATILYFEPK
ncbi:dihydrofolate reductase family protein [Chryseobacterium taiwanense]|uniref:Dihydrofolate reductase n=1 Tax=Chryseobacterium taiwanense TaxID=363331 RepID=A0A0B4DE89_9FLAO|nr:dihydrofolate reductase family protein [Chryseobacterium taiwanense]KIC62690.1 dihydrofolate reductase [Chryseobacterium taiwanense]